MFHKIIFCLQKFCLISMLFVLGKCASVNIVRSTLDLLANWHPVLLIDKQSWKSKLLKQGLRGCVLKELLARHSLFFIGNSRLNCRIIESIFGKSLVYLHTCTLVQSFMSQQSAASNFAISNFPLVTSKIRYFEFCYLNFQERSWIFRFKPYEKSFEKSTTFHEKFAKTKDDFRRISFALLFHNNVNFMMHNFVTAVQFSILQWNHA